MKVTNGKLQKLSAKQKLGTVRNDWSTRVEQLKLVVEMEVLTTCRADMNPVLVLVEPGELEEREEEQGLVANLLAMTGSQTHFILKAVLFLQKFVRAVSRVAEMNRMSVGAVLEKRATHLVRRDSENIVCLRGGATNSRKLATVGDNAVQGDVQVAVAVTITPLTGSTDGAAKPVTILRL